MFLDIIYLIYCIYTYILLRVKTLEFTRFQLMDDGLGWDLHFFFRLFALAMPYLLTLFLRYPNDDKGATHLLSMPLQVINWNGLYSAQPRKQDFTRTRILAHYNRKRLHYWRVVEANVKYVYFYHTSMFHWQNPRRPTGWHGESGKGQSGGHVVVKFRLRGQVHFSTHHIYHTNSAYWVDGMYFIYFVL